MPARCCLVAIVTERISASLQFLLGPRRRVRFWLTDVDAMLVHVPAAAGEERLWVEGAWRTVGLRKGIALP